MSEETFRPDQVQDAIKAFLEYGEQSFVPTGEELGQGHRGYFSGGGWAARCLRWHLAQLKQPQPDAERIARALAVLDAMEERDTQITEALQAMAEDEPAVPQARGEG